MVISPLLFAFYHCRWAEIMTCMQPKTYFLRPDIATQLGIAVVREIIAQKVGMLLTSFLPLRLSHCQLVAAES
jgi:hypothetical protein